MKETVEKEIQFFRIDIGSDNSGKPKIFNPLPVFEHIEKLKFNDEGNYWYDDGKFTGCWVADTKNPCKVSLGTISRTDLPLIENRGELSPLEIPEKAGLVEQTHIVFLGDNIVGCDFNFYGPRITRLPFYFSAKALGVAPEYITFSPILKRDVYQQLKKLKGLSLLNLRVRGTYAERIADVDDSLGAALKAARNAGGNDDIDIELILKISKRRSASWLADSLFSSVKKFAQNPDIRHEVETFKVTGYDPGKQENISLDLLSDKLIIKREIRKLSFRSRAVNPKFAFSAIIEAYEELKDEISQSPSVI